MVPRRQESESFLRRHWGHAERERERGGVGSKKAERRKVLRQCVVPAEVSETASEVHRIRSSPGHASFEAAATDECRINNHR